MHGFIVKKSEPLPLFVGAERHNQYAGNGTRLIHAPTHESQGRIIIHAKKTDSNTIFGHRYYALNTRAAFIQKYAHTHMRKRLSDHENRDSPSESVSSRGIRDGPIDQYPWAGKGRCLA